MNKPVTILTEVTTPDFTVRLSCVLGVFTIEATNKGELEAFLKAIGMDSYKRMGEIESGEKDYAYLDLSIEDFSHGLKSLTRLT